MFIAELKNNKEQMDEDCLLNSKQKGLKYNKVWHALLMEQREPYYETARTCLALLKEKEEKEKEEKEAGAKE